MGNLLERLLKGLLDEEDVEAALLVIIEALKESNQVSQQELNDTTDSVVEALNNYRLGTGAFKPDATIH